MEGVSAVAAVWRIDIAHMPMKTDNYLVTIASDGTEPDDD